MTIKKLYEKQFGKKKYEKLSPRLKKLFERIDSFTSEQKPVTTQQIKKALR